MDNIFYCIVPAHARSTREDNVFTRVCDSVHGGGGGEGEGEGQVGRDTPCPPTPAPRQVGWGPVPPSPCLLGQVGRGLTLNLTPTGPGTT